MVHTYFGQNPHISMRLLDNLTVCKEVSMCQSVRTFTLDTSQHYITPVNIVCIPVNILAPASPLPLPAPAFSC